MEPAFIQDSGQGRVLRIFDATLRLRAAGADTDGQYSLYEGTFAAGGFRPLPHVHRREHESFYVLDGTFTFVVGDETVSASAGTFLHVPPGVPHGFSNGGDGAARLLFIHAPALDRFFDELELVARSGVPDPRLLRQVMERWGMAVKSSAG